MTTKKIAITPEAPEVRFSSAGKMALPRQSFYRLADGSFKSDITTSILYCGKEKVGVVTFDLAPQVGKERLAIKAAIAESDPSDGKALVGDASKFPKAYLEVHYKVAVPKQSATAASVSDIASVAPSTTRSRGSDESNISKSIVEAINKEEQSKDSHSTPVATAVAAASSKNNDEEEEGLDEDMLEEIREKSEVAIAKLKEEK